MNYYYEDKQREDDCDKCHHKFENLGEKIIIVHIGIKRRNLCESCAQMVIRVIDLNEKEEEEDHEENNIAAGV